jgi:hypothetical protein
MIVQGVSMNLSSEGLNFLIGFSVEVEVEVLEDVEDVDAIFSPIFIFFDDLDILCVLIGLLVVDSFILTVI